MEQHYINYRGFHINETLIEWDPFNQKRHTAEARFDRVRIVRVPAAIALMEMSAAGTPWTGRDDMKYFHQEEECPVELSTTANSWERCLEILKAQIDTICADGEPERIVQGF